ncbi:MAG: hypothetical protein K9H64_20390 [Bacteroidales bacterium]|nr:hypothetical protein [Bacteroidales bacterium]
MSDSPRNPMSYDSSHEVVELNYQCSAHFGAALCYALLLWVSPTAIQIAPFQGFT